MKSHVLPSPVPNIYGLIIDPHNDLLPVGPIAQTGGGISIYMPSQLNLQTHYDLTTVDQKCFESLFIEIIRQTRKIIDIVYRPPNLNTHDFVTELNKVLSN